MESVKTLVINSRDRISGSTTNFRYNFNDSIKFHSIKLISAAVPNTYYNIKTNAVFVMSDGLGGTFTITPGNYTIGELTVDIQTQLQVFDANYTVVYNPITMKVTFDNSTPVNFSLLFALQAEAARGLGFALTNLTGLPTYEGPNVPQLIETELIIDSPTIGTLLESVNVRGTFILPQPVIRGNFSDYFEGRFSQYDFKEKRIEQYFEFTLRHIDGTVVDLNGADWQMVFRLNESPVGFELGVHR